MAGFRFPTISPYELFNNPSARWVKIKSCFKMCLNDNNIKCIPRDKLTKRQKNLCNEKLAINRDIICSVLASCLSNFKKPVKCLEGLGTCGTYGLLWEKYFGEDVDVTINGVFEEDFNLISKNLESNGLKGKAVREDPCVLLRKNSYDFIYLNCKTNASWYLDSLFSNVRENSVFVITTSEDPSLYWQTSDIALRNYGGVIGKTSYHREVSVRLVIAEMARAAARYNKGLKIDISVAYKPQQSFTIVAKVKKGIIEANNCIQNNKKLAHCSLCEDRKFIANSIFLDKINYTLNCNCSKESEGKVIINIGPLWTGDIFNVEFIESVLKNLDGFPWKTRIFSLLNLILEEARCEGGPQHTPPSKKMKTNFREPSGLPYFYINTHRHSAKEFGLRKLSDIIWLLKKNGYRASRTHFDSEAVRTNASVNECIKIVRESFNTHRSI